VGDEAIGNGQMGKKQEANSQNDNHTNHPDSYRDQSLINHHKKES
jgi:hypothetical protein